MLWREASVNLLGVRVKKGQGTFEYVLLLAGVLLIVVLAIVLLRGGVFGGGAKDVALQGCRMELTKSPNCYAGGVWNEKGEMPVGDACKSFIIAYPDSAGKVTSCEEIPDAGKDLYYKEAQFVPKPEPNPVAVCCGKKPA